MGSVNKPSSGLWRLVSFTTIPVFADIMRKVAPAGPESTASSREAKFTLYPVMCSDAGKTCLHAVMQIG